MTIFFFNRSLFLFLLVLFLHAACQQESKNYAASITIDIQAATVKADTLSAEQTYEFAKTISPASEQDSFYMALLDLKSKRYDAKALREHLAFYQKLRTHGDYPEMLYAYYFGTAEFIEKNLESSKKSLNKAMILHENFDDPTRKCLILWQSARTLQELGDFPEAIAYFLEALSIAQKNGDQRMIAYIQLSMSTPYTLIRSYDKALEMGKLAAKYYREKEIVELQAVAYNSIGQAYKQKSVIDSADLYYQKSLEIQKLLGDPIGLAQNYGQYANFWIGQKDYPKALAAAKEAYTWNQKGGYRLLDVPIEALLGNAFCKVGNTTDGLKHLDHALDLSNKNKMTQEIVYLNETLSSVYEEMGKEKLALEHYKKFTAIEDSLFTVSKQKILDELNIKYETAEKEKKLAAITHKAKTDRMYGIFGALMLLGLGVGMWFRQRAKNKTLLQKNLILNQEQEISDQNKKLAEAEALLVKEQLHLSQSELKKAEEAKSSLANLLILKNKLLEDVHIQEQKFRQPEAFEVPEQMNPTLRILTKEQWKQFKNQFQEQQPGFLLKMKELHPTLTSAEIRLFLLIKLRFNNNEASDTLGISKDSIYRNRMRLAKKLELDGAGGLDDYVGAFAV